MRMFDVKYILYGAAFFLLLLSILCRVMTGVLLKKLAKEAENLSTTQNLLLRQCRLKFQNCYELNDGNMNVEIFVEKFIQSVRLGKCSLRLLNLVSGQLLLLFVLLCGVFICISLAQGEGMREVLPGYLVAFAGIYAYFAVSGLVDVRGKRERLKTTIVDFFENRMLERLKGVKRDSAYLDEVERAGVSAHQDESVGGQILPEGKDMPDAAKIISSTELETLLSEFLA